MSTLIFAQTVDLSGMLNMPEENTNFWSQAADTWVRRLVFRVSFVHHRTHVGI